MEELLQRNVNLGDAETLRKNLKSFKDAKRQKREEQSRLVELVKSGAEIDEI